MRINYILTIVMLISCGELQAQTDEAATFSLNFKDLSTVPISKSIASPQIGEVDRKRFSKAVSKIKQRSKKIGMNQLFVIAYDESGQEVDRKIITDPRLIRAESADNSGRLISKEIIFNENVVLPIVLQNADNIKIIHIFKPEYVNGIQRLKLIGVVKVP